MATASTPLVAFTDARIGSLTGDGLVLRTLKLSMEATVSTYNLVTTGSGFVALGSIAIGTGTDTTLRTTNTASSDGTLALVGTTITLSRANAGTAAQDYLLSLLSRT